MADTDKDVFAEMLGMKRPTPVAVVDKPAPVAESVDSSLPIVEANSTNESEVADDQVKEEPKQNEADIQRIAELTSALEALKAAEEARQAEVESLKSEIVAIKDENDKLRMAYVDAQNEIAALEEKVDRLFRNACRFRAALPPTSPAVLLANGD